MAERRLVAALNGLTPVSNQRGSDRRRASHCNANRQAAACRLLTNIILVSACGGSACGGSGAKDATATAPATGAAAAKIAVSAGDNQIAAAGAAVSQAPSVRVNDANGNAVSGVVVTFVVTSGGGTITGATETTNSSGAVTGGTWTLGPTAAINQLEARVAGLSPAVIEARSWAISPTSVVLHTIGESQGLRAFLGADSSNALSLSVVTESRWLQEFAVTDAAALTTGIVRAVSPGSSRIHIRAFGLDLGDVSVSVAPTAPIVFSVTQPHWPNDPTLFVRGFQMNALSAGAVLVGGLPATKLSADSAQLSANPGISATTNCVLSSTDSVSIPGVTSLWAGTVHRPAAMAAIAVGDTITLQGDSPCFKLPPQVGSYVLAQVERSVMDRAVTTPEVYQDTVSIAPYTFSVTDRNVVSAAVHSPQVASIVSRQRRPLPVQNAAMGDVHVLSVRPSVADIWSQSTPWAVGDLISSPGIANIAIPWRVMRLYPNHVVLAISQSDSALLWTPAVIAKLDSALAFMLSSTGLSVFQSTWGSVYPTTSSGSGQYLILLERRAQQGLNQCSSAGVSAMQIGSVQVGVLPADGQGGIGDPPAAALLRTLSHEYTHAFDCMRTQNSGARWSVEGIADFNGEEMYRTFLGIAADGNIAYDVGFVPPQPASSLYTWWDLPNIGQFQNGYSESEPFMRQLAWWLSTSFGVPWEQARATVILGSREGWYGHNNPGPGLTARVRQIAGAQWQPVDARLHWVLSLAADDRTTGAAATFQYPPLLQSWRALQSGNIFSLAGWTFYRGTVVAGVGQSVSGSARADDDGYILISDPNGLGAALELKSSAATMVWRLLRYR